MAAERDTNEELAHQRKQILKRLEHNITSLTEEVLDEYLAEKWKKNNPDGSSRLEPEKRALILYKQISGNPDKYSDTIAALQNNLLELDAQISLSQKRLTLLRE